MGMMSGIGALLGRWSWAGRLGMQFAGARDLYGVFGWKRVPIHEDFVAKYLRQGIAQRINDSVPKAIWTEPPELEGGSHFNSAWKRLVDDFNPFPALYKTDSFAGLGSCAICVIGFNDGRNLAQPVGKATKILYMQPYLEGSVQVTAFEEDQTNPRFGKPTEYEVTPGEVLTSRMNTTIKLQLRNKFKVHWTRVLHVADNTLENSVFGHSRLEPIYNDLDDLLKVTGGAAETFWLAGNRGMQVNVDKEMDLDEEDEQALTQEVEEYQHQLRRIIRTRGVEINNLGSDVADPRPTVSSLLGLISSQTGIPQRVLMGAEAGQLASQQDRANWADRVKEKIRLYAEPVILIQFVDLCVQSGLLPSRYSRVIWPDAFKLNPLERAQSTAQMARSAVNVVRAMEVAQKGKFNLISVEEAREMIAPGERMPVLDSTPVGTFPPDIEEVDPAKFGLLPEQQAAAEAIKNGDMTQTEPNTPSDS